MPSRPLSRRTVLLGAGAATALSACGNGSDRAPSDRSAEAGGTFPATAEHRFGTTTIEQRPRRIVVVGLTEQDILLALGHTPIATTEWYGNQPGAVWPWAQRLLGDAQPVVLRASDGFDFERIAALEPDLLIGTNSGMEQDDYDKLSALAPTIAGPKDGAAYFAPWRSQTQLVGDALGLGARARHLVEDVERRYATARRQHREFAGKSVVFLQNAVSDGSYIAYPEGLNTDFVTDLGLTVPSYLDRYARDGAQSYIPAEQIDLIDGADVLLWATEKAADLAALEGEATFTNLAPVEQNRSVYTDGVLAGAIYFTTPLSLPYVVEHLTPLLSVALDGSAPRQIRAG